jgi:hypothetical protein
MMLPVERRLAVLLELPLVGLLVRLLVLPVAEGFLANLQEYLCVTLEVLVEHRPEC